MSIPSSLFFLILSAVVLSSKLSAQATLGVQLDRDATVTQVAPGSAGEKAGLKIGDIIIGLNNGTLKQGAAEVSATLAKTRGGSLLPVSIRRNGHVMTLLAFPTAAGGSNAPNAGIAPVPGHYTCLTFTFQGGGLNGLAEAPSSLSTGIDLMPGGQYKSLGRTGSFHADTRTDRLVFDSGLLANSVAHLERDTNGRPKIMFVQNENRTAVNGHEIDHGPTGCYLR